MGDDSVVVVVVFLLFIFFLGVVMAVFLSIENLSYNELRQVGSIIFPILEHV